MELTLGSYINYIIYTALMCFMVYHLVSVARRHLTYGIYEACGLACFFSVLFLNGWKFGPCIMSLRIIGLILYIPAVLLLASAFIILRRKGKPKDVWEQTTVIIDSGVLRIVRHPLYLGVAIWAVGLMLVFQSVLSTVLGTATIFCYWMASKKEDQFNINKFGDEYKNYMRNVPGWNFIKGLWILRKPNRTKT